MEVFRFANPNYLYALALIPAFIAIYIFFQLQRKKALELFGNSKILAPLMPNTSSPRQIIKFTALMIATTFLILAIARPQYGAKLQKIKRKGVEIIIALDVSNSMMAEDIQPNRLERAKRAIERLTERLDNDKIGLIVFAGNAYTQIPITNDYSSAKLFLPAVKTTNVPKQGTAIGAAIELASKSFTPESKTSKAIIVITDGENHEDDAVGAAQAASNESIVVHTIGMGLPQGGPIPVSPGSNEFWKDSKGSVVVTKLDEKMLQEISQAGKGIYVRANNAEVGLNRIFDEINKMEKSELESRVYSDYNDQFIPFISLAFAFIILNLLLLERKNKLLKNVRLFSSLKGKSTSN